MNKEVKLIMERINKLFTRAPHTRYRINVANNVYEKQYNFFFEIIPHGQRMHSIPLHSVNVYTLDYLEQVIKMIQQQTQLTIKYVGFTDMKWPESQRTIQKRPDIFE